MNVSAVSSYWSGLAQEASQMKGQEIQQAIGASVLKTVMDQQKVNGEALVQMIQQTPGQPSSTGHIDLRV